MKRILAFVITAFMHLSMSPATGQMAAPPAAISTQSKNEAVAMRVFEEILNQGKFGVADEIYAKDFVNHGLHRVAGLEEDQAAARWEKKAVPDLTMTVDLIYADSDLVTVVWTARGTNTAAADGIPATGAKLELRGITVWRIVDGKIREEWTSYDRLRIINQVVSHLKWLLIGVLLALPILIFITVRFIRSKRLARGLQV
ncbi:MAG TPA: ester cyclase [Candidatus Acidoferrales bacterium]|nr:ester cyclase [Candidatus Acidoferrales bacterium]